MVIQQWPSGNRTEEEHGKVLVVPAVSLLIVNTSESVTSGRQVHHLPLFLRKETEP